MLFVAFGQNLPKQKPPQIIPTMVCGGKCLQVGAENSHPKMVSPGKSCVSPKNTPITPCAWCKISLVNHCCCIRLKLPIPGSDINSHSHHPSLFKKKVFEKNLHFLHQTKKMPIKPELFRCRIGCRILLPLGVILHQQHYFGWLHALFCMVWLDTLPMSYHGNAQ